MSAQSQLGFSFEAEPVKQFPELLAPGIVEARAIEVGFEYRNNCMNEEIVDPPELEPEQKPLFEGLAPVSREQEPEIPWADYIRKVELYFNKEQFEAFRENVSKLAVKYGTESVTDTVAMNLQKAVTDGTN